MRMRDGLLCLLISGSGGSAWADDEPKKAAPNALQPDPDAVGFLQSKIQALEESLLESKNDLALLKKFRVAGYIQARYTYLDADKPVSSFTVRRARLKSEYVGEVARYTLEVETSSTGVSLKVGEAAITEPWSGKKMFTLTAGQTKVPFGFGGPQSSADREFPELVRAVNSFTNGEYDRGVKLGFRYAFVRAQVGVFDGNGTSQKEFVGKDNDNEKDVIGRVGVDFGWIAAGVSGWTGLTLNPATGRFAPRKRIGADAQLYLDLFPFGGTAIKAEFIAGTTYQESGVERAGQSGLGWEALLVQNIGTHEQIALRYDFWNPAAGRSLQPDVNDPTKPAATNWTHTAGILVSHYFDDVVKVSAVFEIPITATSTSAEKSPRANLFTLQAQAKF